MEEIKKMGRPIVGASPKNKRQEIRMTEEEQLMMKERAESGKETYGQYITRLIREDYAKK